MFSTNFLPLPVHAGRALVINLHSVHTDVALAGFGIARDHAGQRDEASSIFGPALQHREIQQRKVIALDHFLARSGGHSLRKKFPHFCKHGEHFYFVEKSLRGFHVHERADAVGYLIEGVDFKRQVHAAGGTELVDQDLRSGMAFDVGEEQCGAAWLG